MTPVSFLQSTPSRQHICVCVCVVEAEGAWISKDLLDQDTWLLSDMALDGLSVPRNRVPREGRR